MYRFAASLLTTVALHLQRSKFCPILVGQFLLAAALVTASFGQDSSVAVTVGLVLLGVGWNLLFTAGTSLLATHYTGAERHRAQAINDFVVFSSQAVVSLLAGLAVTALGWQWTNLSVLPLLAVMLWISRREVPRPVRALTAPSP